MELNNRKLLERLKRKNRGNKLLSNEIDKLIEDIESSEWKNQIEVNLTRPDADCVHSDGFYFFNIAIHRTMVLLSFDDGQVTIIWVGNHQKYEEVFKNNKNVIRKWLKSNGWIN